MPDDYEQADASCGFCNGPMPCWCPDPLSDAERAETHERDADAQNRVGLPRDDSRD